LLATRNYLVDFIFCRLILIHLGLLAVIVIILMIGFIKLSLAEKLTARNIKFYLVAGSVFLILVL